MEYSQNCQKQKYRQERMECIESILESIRFIKRLYSGKNRDDDIDGLLFRWERKKLLSKLFEFKRLFDLHRSTLLQSPSEEAEAGDTFVTVINSAIGVIENVPSRLKRFKYVPVVKYLEKRTIELVKPEDIAYYVNSCCQTSQKS